MFSCYNINKTNFWPIFVNDNDNKPGTHDVLLQVQFDPGIKSRDAFCLKPVGHVTLVLHSGWHTISVFVTFFASQRHLPEQSSLMKTSPTVYVALFTLQLTKNKYEKCQLSMVNALYALLRSTKYLSIFWKENIDAATIEFNTS